MGYEMPGFDSNNKEYKLYLDSNKECSDIVGSSYSGLYVKDNNVIYVGSGEFRSERNIECGNFAYWNSKRVSKIVPVGMVDVSIDKIIKTYDFNLLPQKFINQLLSGKIPRTQPCYIQPKEKSVYKGILDYMNPHLESKKYIYPDAEYSVLIFSDNEGIPNGRTGILFENNEPLVVEIGGVKYFVEVKAIGSVDGKSHRKRTLERSGVGGPILSTHGLASKEEAVNEFYGYIYQNEDPDVVRPKVVASIIYKDDNIRATERQGLIVRLTPSNIRASFDFDFENKPSFSKIRENTVDELVYFLSQENPLIHSSPHAENLLFNGSRYVFTDLADVGKLRDLKEPERVLHSALIDSIDGMPFCNDSDKDKMKIDLCLKAEISASNDFKEIAANLYKRFK